MESLSQKFEKLKNLLREMDRVAIAFSGGVDSTFLLKVAHDVLGDRAVAVTVRQRSFPERELRESEDFCTRENIVHVVREHDELSIEGFAQNPKDRCYLCKKSVFGLIGKVAGELSLRYVCEGSNTDDNRDYRPGHRAIAELGIRSPLRDCGFSKADIRELSRQLNLPTAEKPSFACLSSRFVYGETITEQKLRMVEKGEEFLRTLGIKQLRVRIHGENVARIEVLPENFDTVLKNRELIFATFKNIGFAYVSLDLQGYRTGSMNETLTTNNTLSG